MPELLAAIIMPPAPDEAMLEALTLELTLLMPPLAAVLLAAPPMPELVVAVPVPLAALAVAKAENPTGLGVVRPSLHATETAHAPITTAHRKAMAHGNVKLCSCRTRPDRTEIEPSWLSPCSAS
jgi:hypothetical protein